jgi:hypothetical protein
MIIDAHDHLGYDYVFDEEAIEDSFIYYYTKYKVDGAIVQPFINRPYIQDTRDIHNRIYEFSKKRSGQIWGMTWIAPTIMLI